MTTSPIAQAQGDAVRPLRTGAGGGEGRGGGLDRERNEVADLFDERAQRVTGNKPRLGAQLLCAR